MVVAGVPVPERSPRNTSRTLSKLIGNYMKLPFGPFGKTPIHCTICDIPIGKDYWNKTCITPWHIKLIPQYPFVIKSNKKLRWFFSWKCCFYLRWGDPRDWGGGWWWWWWWWRGWRAGWDWSGRRWPRGWRGGLGIKLRGARSSCDQWSSLDISLWWWIFSIPCPWNRIYRLSQMEQKARFKCLKKLFLICQ